jgi:hypothetical protein
VVQTQDIFWGELVVVYRVVCSRSSAEYTALHYFLTIFNVRRLLERRDLDDGETHLGQVFVRGTDPSLQPLLGVVEFLALHKPLQSWNEDGAENLHA